MTDPLLTLVARAIEGARYEYVPDDDWEPLGSELRIAQAALSVIREQEGWRPIGEAPKDGAWIIALTEGGAIPVVWGAAWNTPCWVNGRVIYDPTYFRPLPAPPLEKM